MRSSFTSLLRLIADSEKLDVDELPALYHISFNKELPTTLLGKLPDGFKADGPAGRFEEPNIERISFSTTLVGAFRGVFSNLTDAMVDRGSKGITYTVYTATSIDGKVLDSVQLAPYIHDALVTHEVCVFGMCKIKKIGTVTFVYNPFEPWMTYKPFGKESQREHSPANIESEFLNG